MYSRPEAAALAICVEVFNTLRLQYPLVLDKAVQLAGSNDDNFKTVLDQLVQMDAAAKEQWMIK